VILEIPPLLERLLPELLAGARPSVACVRTTRPVFLVFGADTSKPACVVQVGPREALERFQSVLTRLHTLLPDLVPRPLACEPLAEGAYVLALSGLAGVPWFRLKDGCRCADDWIRLRARALDALTRLHGAIRVVSEWRCRIRPGDELRERLETCLQGGVLLDARIRDDVARAEAELDTLGEVSSFWQHGDFCLNNLLLSDGTVGIIDFEELGCTAMPLHDQLGLALSVYEFAVETDVLRGPPKGDIEICTRAAGAGNAFEPRHMAGLLWHHLLFRIAQCLDRPIRARRQASLLDLARWFARSPDDFLPHFMTRCSE